MTTETVYIANDDKRFNNAEECINYEEKIEVLQEFKNTLVRVPYNVSGGQYIQRDVAVIEDIRKRFWCAMAQIIPLYKEKFTSIAKGETHQSWGYRVIDDSGYRLPCDIAYILQCIDDQGRQFDQPYYVYHPESVTSEYIPNESNYQL